MAMARVRRIATVALLTLAIAGCSSSGSGSAPQSTGGGSTASAPSTKPAAVSAQGKLDGVPKACPSADEVMSNLNLSKLVVSGDDPSICQYLFNGDKASPYAVVTFNAAPGFTPAMLKDGLAKEQTDIKAVSGLADAAYTFTPTGATASDCHCSAETRSAASSRPCRRRER
jgi:hypothetical protein